MATFAEVLNVKSQKNEAEDSYCFLPAIDVKADPENETLVRSESVLQAANGTLSYRKREWKLIHYSQGKPDATHKDELYNLATDPYEKTDVAEQYPELLQDMSERLKKVLKKNNNQKKMEFGFQATNFIKHNIIIYNTVNS